MRRRVNNSRQLFHSYVIIFCVFVLCFKSYTERPSTKKAEQTAQAYAHAIDYEYKTPEKIYAFMTDDFKSHMSEYKFIKAFKKERSYPYLTPLFINYDGVQMDEGKKSGKVVYSQAARLPGMVHTVSLIFEDGEYHVKDFDDFLDDSYLKKFDTVSYSLDSYFDFDNTENKEK